MTDPRPYNYQFRRPRDNRTYQSYNAYESLYHMGKVQPSAYGNNYMGDHYSSRVNRYSPANQHLYSSNMFVFQQIRAQQPHYESYQMQPKTHQIHYESIGINTDRNSNKSQSNRSVKSRSSSMSSNGYPQQSPQGRNSILSTYGSTSIPQNQSINQLPPAMKKQQVTVVYSNYNDTANVYRKQQRPFDIINLYSRPTEPLRKFPKLTRQNLIMERGMDLA